MVLLTNNGLHAEFLKGGVVLILSGGRSELLATRINRFDVDYQKNPRDQLGKLWSTPEVTREVNSLKIQVGPFNDIGITSLTPTPADANVGNPGVREPIVYKDQSVLAILSDALRRRTGLIWQFTEAGCPSATRALFDIVDPGTPD